MPEELENKNDEQVSEQDLETLAQLKAEREQHIAEQAKLQKQNEAKQAELRALQLEAAVEREFDAFSRSTGVKFHGRTNDVFKLMSESFDVKQSQDGSVALMRKGSADPISFADALEIFVGEHPYWCASLGVLRPESERIQSRSDFKNNDEKTRWISKHGLRAWERLPQHRIEQVCISTMSAEQYRRLPVQQRLEIVNKFGADGVAAILRRR